MLPFPYTASLPPWLFINNDVIEVRDFSPVLKLLRLCLFIVIISLMLGIVVLASDLLRSQEFSCIFGVNLGMFT